MKRQLLGGLAAFLLALPAAAFPHVVEKGETLAKIAERFYGRIQLERVLVTANHLEQSGARGIAPGMVLEIPSVSYHRVASGETWKDLASRLLGDERRAIFLAEANGQRPWIEPELGQVVQIPYNLSWVATGQESLSTLAYRFLGGTKQAWALTQYNDLEKRDIVRGEILLLPLTDLPLTAEGKTAAERARSRLDAEARGDSLRRQTNSKGRLRDLSLDVKSGRYASAVAIAAELLASGELSSAQKSQVQWSLVEAYVALGATGLARSTCERYLETTEHVELDPILTSPKILAVCPNEEAPANAGDPKGAPR